ncbi:MAG TPA: hypothetical protein VIZ65_13870 [Cellvibrionaceae bacterium]
MSVPKRFYNSSPKRQQGIATILIIVLVGLGLTATSMGIMHSVRSTQQKQIASHAITHAQAGAWTGVEVFRRYLASLTTTQLTALALNQPIDFTLPGTTNNVNATISERTPPSGSDNFYSLKTRLTYTDIAAKSSAALEVIYAFAPPASNAGVTINGQMNFHRTLGVSGDITIVDPSPTTKGTFNVDGNLTVNYIGLTGLVNLNSTGDISLGAGSASLQVKANGKITLTGSASAESLEGLNGVLLSQYTATKATTIKSNGLVQLFAGPVSTVTTTGNVEIDSNSNIIGKVTANGTLKITSGTLTTADIIGTSLINSTNPTVTTLNSKGAATCPGVSWIKFTNITTSSTATNCKTGTNLKTNTTVTITPVVPLTPFAMIKPRIDVWALKNSANYVFEMEGTKFKVSVKNVNGVADGIYYLGDNTYSSVTTKYALCTAVNTSNVCTAPTASPRTPCSPQGATPCFAYDSTLKKFKITSTSLAPGAMWFNGNLEVSDGSYYNTFLATGSVTTSGQALLKSINYSGYSNICSITYKGTFTGFSTMYPKNFCNMTTSTFISNPLGNPAIIAGGYDPSLNGAYSGGDITLSSSNAVYGSILAGDTLNTSGSTKIYGYITAASLAPATDTNSLAGSTTIDVSGLPSTYTPNIIPDMNPAPAADPDTARVLWSRFL